MIAKGFAKHGAKVYITGRRPQMLEEAAKIAVVMAMLTRMIAKSKLM